MKLKALFLALLFVEGLGTKALASTVGDTLVLEKVDCVRIETRDTVQRIVISGLREDPEFMYMQRISIPDTTAVRRRTSTLMDINRIVVKNKDGKPSKWEICGDLFFGLGTMTGAPHGYSMWPSFEVGLGAMAEYHPFGPKNTWSTGLLFGGVFMHTPSNRYWTKNGQSGKEMMLEPYEEGLEKTYSSLNVVRFAVPLLYRHGFDKRCRWSLTLGALVNFNVGANATRHFTVGDEDYDITLNHLGVRPVTIEPVVMFNAPYVPTIYCKYSPMTLFKDGRGPKMKLLTFGLFL